ncbi:hypothetical protein BgiMline_012039 [Biomphalaria glabrata]|nr:hypothetical protein BgiMline_030637 [Biomphalaria glabrata]
MDISEAEKQLGGSTSLENDTHFGTILFYHQAVPVYRRQWRLCSDGQVRGVYLKVIHMDHRVSSAQTLPLRDLSTPSGSTSHPLSQRSMLLWF